MEENYVVIDEYIYVEKKYPSGGTAREGYGYIRKIEAESDFITIKAGEVFDLKLQCKIWNMETNSYMIDEYVDYPIRVTFNNEAFNLPVTSGEAVISLFIEEAGRYTVGVDGGAKQVGGMYIGVTVNG
jgi:hypothetical protein